MGSKNRSLFLLLIISKICGCTVTKKTVYTCCKDIYASGTYKYSADSNWTTDKLLSEEWDSENVPLAYIEYFPLSEKWATEVEQVLSGSIYLRRCLNLTYSATDEKFKEIHIRFIVTGCTKEEQNNACKVTSNLHYLALLVLITRLVFILAIK